MGQCGAASDQPRRDVAEPAAVTRSDLECTLDLLRERAAAAPHHVAFLVPDSQGHPVELTLPDFLERVDAVAARLLRLGVQAGDGVAILGSTSFAWAVAEWAIWRAGGVVIPLYETAPAASLSTVLEQTQTRVAFVDASREADLRSVTDVPLVVLRPDDPLAEGLGITPSDADAHELQARRRTREDPATIVYTSGTSGEPRGTVIAHRNLVDLVLNVQSAWSDVLEEQGTTVIFLPLAHVLARGLQTICLWSGMRVSYLADPSAVVRSLPEIKPTFLVVVPRVLEKIREAARTNAAKARLGWVWADAERVAVAAGRAAEESDRTGQCVRLAPQQAARHRLYSRLFYRSLRARLGGELRFMLCGAAPLDPELSLLFRGMGLPVMEGYGLTETTAPLAGNRPGQIRSGSVGRPVPGTSVRRDASGLLWVKGVGVSPGYLDEGQTQESFAEGWLNTGDLCEIDDDGFIYLTGRVKDVIVTSGGKTVSPARWSQAVEAHPLVAHALAVGDGRPYLTAVLFLDPEALSARGLDHAATGPEALQIADPALLRELDEAVAAANLLVARSEGVKRWAAVVVDLSPEAGWVTATLKLRRPVAAERLQALISGLYRSPAGS